MSCIIERRDMLRYLRESNEDLQCQAADEIERLQSGCDNCLKQVLINSDTHQGEIKELSNKILEISLKNERLEIKINNIGKAAIKLAGGAPIGCDGLMTIDVDKYNDFVMAFNDMAGKQNEN